MSSYEIDTYRKWSARTTLNETWGGGLDRLLVSDGRKEFEQFPSQKATT